MRENEIEMRENEIEMRETEINVKCIFFINVRKNQLCIRVLIYL